MSRRHHTLDSAIAMPLRKPLALALLLATAMPAALAADLYRWVDNKGNVHYTDRVPAEYMQNGYRVINKQGLTVTTIAPKKDESSVKKEDSESRAQQERDRRLLTTYASAEEINAARDRKLAEIKSAISLRQENIALLEKQFREQTREAGDYEKQGEPVPEALRANINTTKKKITAHEEAIRQQQQQLLDAQNFYGEELERYKKVTQVLEQKPPGK